MIEFDKEIKSLVMAACFFERDLSIYLCIWGFRVALYVDIYVDEMDLTRLIR